MINDNIFLIQRIGRCYSNSNREANVFANNIQKLNSNDSELEIAARKKSELQRHWLTHGSSHRRKTQA